MTATAAIETISSRHHPLADVHWRAYTCKIGPMVCAPPKRRINL
jgi:hypothetical protein